jgi:hypothetical protein
VDGWETDDATEEWPPLHRGLIRAMALVVSLALALGAVGTVVEVLVRSH